MQPSVSRATYEVRDPAHRLVASGKVKGGREAALSLPPGTYTYRSLANRLTQPFEELTFSVLGCVQVVPRCRAVEVENPNAATLGGPADQPRRRGDGGGPATATSRPCPRTRR